jgi:hypothetical protein
MLDQLVFPINLYQTNAIIYILGIYKFKHFLIIGGIVLCY